MALLAIFHQKERRKCVKKRRLWVIMAIVSLCVCIVGFVVQFISGKNTQAVESYETDAQNTNQSIAYDEENEIFYIGSHEGKITAIQDGELLWQKEFKGAFRKVVLSEDKATLYGANESNRIHVLNTADGSEKLELDTKRKVVAVAVNADESHIAVLTNTGSSKSNLLIYSAAGEELENVQYTKRLKAIEYSTDGQTLMLADARGDLSRITEQGEVLEQFSAEYEINHMKKYGDTYWIVTKAGTYFGIDESLQCFRKGKIDNTVKATVTSIGVDKQGEYILVGTREGYIFVLDQNDKQVYVADMEIYITDTAAADGSIFTLGYGTQLWRIRAERLANIEAYQLLSKCAVYVTYIALALFIIGFIGSIPRANVAAGKLLKAMWKQRMAYILLFPTFLLLYLFSFRGIYTALIRSFTNWSATNMSIAEIDFVGLDNYKMMFEEGYFLLGMKNLLILLVTGILKTLTVPLAVAWMIFSTRGSRRKYIHRFLFVLPMVVPGIVSSLVWLKIYDPTIGLLNQILETVGLENLQRVWLGDVNTAIWAVVFMGFPFISAMALLVYYGGLINIGDDVVESAVIDGANRWNIFWKIQLPMIRSQIGLMVTLTILGTMQDFNGIFILTGGGPGTATYVPALELYLNASQYGRYGYASALGVVLLIFTMTVTLISNKLTKEKE